MSPAYVLAVSGALVCDEIGFVVVIDVSKWPATWSWDREASGVLHQGPHHQRPRDQQIGHAHIMNIPGTQVTQVLENKKRMA